VKRPFHSRFFLRMQLEQTGCSSSGLDWTYQTEAFSKSDSSNHVQLDDIRKCPFKGEAK